jgi:hypothetical protein
MTAIMPQPMDSGKQPATFNAHAAAVALFIFSAKRNDANRTGAATPSARLSAVEGIRLTPAMKKRAADAKRNGLSAEEYRQTIVTCLS